MSFWSRLANVFRSDRLDRDLEDEQRFHIQERADDLQARGLSREEALAQAARQFGTPLQLRESSRDIKLMPWLESIARDLAFGVRLLRKDPIVSASAVISLGLAIGACTAAVSLIDALVLRALPVRDPDGLVILQRAAPDLDQRFTSVFSHPWFVRARAAAPNPLDVFSMSYQSLRQAVLPDSGGVEEKVQTQFVSGNAFDVLGVKAAIGRVLQPADDVTPKGHPVAVVSHAFWRRRFGGAQDAVGRWIRIEQTSYQIVGVAQPGFTGSHPGVLTDVWLPNMMFQGESLSNPEWNWLQVWGRVSAGARADAIKPVLETALANFDAEIRVSNKAAPRPASASALDLVSASTGHSRVRQMFQGPLFALASLVAAVLLIACSNIANLMLARGATRRREHALRASIGAGRGRLMQQVLVESSVLTIAAVALGLICAMVATPFLIGMLNTNENPIYLDTRLDWRVLVCVALLGGVTTALFGLAPALRASSVMPAEATTLDDRRFTERQGTAPWLVTVQIGFSAMLLFVALLLLRSYDRLLGVDLGFVPDRLALLTIEARDRFEPAKAHEISRQLVAHAAAMPGVDSASLSNWALFRGWSNNGTYDLPGGGHAQTMRLSVSAGFFRTMGTRLLEGREFEPRDLDAIEVIPLVVNEAFTRRYFPGAHATGQRLSARRYEREVAYEIIGVAANAHDGSVRDAIGPCVFEPIGDADGTLQIRSSLPPGVLADRLRQELPRINPSLRLVDVTVQSALVGSVLLRERLLSVLSSFFAALGLVLAAVGLYGVVSYAVVRRTREIGIRLSLGATPSSIVHAVTMRVAYSAAAGTIAGLVAGIYFARFVRALLFEIEPSNVASVGAPALCLLVVAAIAAGIPARRAARIDPAEALRLD